MPHSHSLSRRATLRALLATAFGTVPAVRAAEESAPPLSLPDASGHTLSLASLRGQVVYVDFWASWCDPCRESFPWMNSMQRSYGTKGLKILAVNLDRERALAEKFLQALKPEFTVLFDPAAVTAKAWGVSAMPSSYLVSTTGALLLRHRGFRAKDAQSLEAKFRAALGLPAV